MYIRVAGQEEVHVGISQFEKFRETIAQALGVGDVYFKHHIMSEKLTDFETTLWNESVSPYLSNFLHTTACGGIVSPEACSRIAQELSQIEIDTMGEYAELTYQFWNLLNAAAKTETILYWA